MQVRLVIRIVSAVLLVCGLAMLTSVPIGLLKGDDPGVIWALLGSSLLTCGVGVLGAWHGPKATAIRVREGFGIVTFSWIAAALFGALPFTWAGHMTYVDAVFETMSGFTTTGATVLSAATPDGVYDLPWGLLYWRSLTHWLGGMGIVVLSLAILPLLGIGAMTLYRSEAPGPTSDQVTPRVAHTAQRLWAVYLLLSVVETLLLWPKMDLLEAWCHTCATMATGGFSTRAASVAAFDSAYVDWVLTVFMLLAGTNFLLHYRAILGRPQDYVNDEECRFYIYIVGAATLLTALTLYGEGLHASIGSALRHAAFTVASIMTTTGFVTADFDLWPVVIRVMLVLLMFVGGCGGSTGGGMKCSRVAILLKHALAQVKRTLYPRSLANIRLNDHSVAESVVSRILGFFFLYMACFVLFGVVLCAIEPNLGKAVGGVVHSPIETAFSASIATLSNIGPGLGQVGPVQHYGWFAWWSKLLLVGSMLLGRLELFTVLVLFHPRFWRR